jgi:NAD(P)-dependent dehydrogenase (short-subunit alcohol dehydrogenase family)
MTVEESMASDLDRFRLDGRVVVVTGGYGGIGARLAQAFVDVGGRVAILGRDGAKAQAQAEALGDAALAVGADVTRRDEVDAAFADVLACFGRVDGLVTTVGGGAGDAVHPAESYPDEAWDRIMDLNLRSALYPAQAAARAMIAGGHGGHVLHLSSVRGQLGIRSGFSAYVAAKGALDALTRQQASEWAAHQITVNAIAPTFVRTAQVAGLLSDDAFRTGLEQRIPLGRIAETDDVVGAALLLCSDASAFITGQVLTLDGGLTACQ